MAPVFGNIGDTDLVAGVRRRYGVDVLDTLLKDHATGKNIIWADREYEKLGAGYEPYDEITQAKICDRRVIEPRVVKSIDQQAWRTKEKAEVFTPSWLCKQMVDCLDDAFFGSEPVGFVDGAETGLTEMRMKSLAVDGRWKDYIDNRLLEITCGEAPFICSPYDATTGEFVPTGERIGFLDRKLRVVNLFARADYETWWKWAVRAVEASYGYEYQGDNLLIARINVLNTVSAFKEDAWGEPLSPDEARTVANRVSWNLWQMDGLRGCVPSEWDVPEEEDPQMSMFDLEGFLDEPEEDDGEPEQPTLFAVPCMVYDWRARKPQTWESLKG